MGNIAVSEVLTYMEGMRTRIKVRAIDAERSIEKHVQDRVRANEMIAARKIEIADGEEALRWLDAEIDRMGQSS